MYKCHGVFETFSFIFLHNAQGYWPVLLIWCISSGRGYAALAFKTKRDKVSFIPSAIRLLNIHYPPWRFPCPLAVHPTPMVLPVGGGPAGWRSGHAASWGCAWLSSMANPVPRCWQALLLGLAPDEGPGKTKQNNKNKNVLLQKVTDICITVHLFSVNCSTTLLSIFFVSFYVWLPVVRRNTNVCLRECSSSGNDCLTTM